MRLYILVALLSCIDGFTQNRLVPSDYHTNFKVAIDTLLPPDTIFWTCIEKKALSLSKNDSSKFERINFKGRTIDFRFGVIDSMTQIYGGEGALYIARDIFCDSKGRLWFATIGGVYIFDNGSGRHLTPEDGLCSNVINSFYEDVLGSIWIVSGNGRVSQVTEDSIFNFRISKEALLGVNSSKDDDLIFYGYSGIYVKRKDIMIHFSRKQGLNKGGISVLNADSSMSILGGQNGINFLQNDEIISSSDTLIKSPINSIIRDQHGFLWLATEGQGLMLVNNNCQTLINLEFEETDTIRSLLFDSDSNLWIVEKRNIYFVKSKNLIHYYSSLESRSDIQLQLRHYHKVICKSEFIANDMAVDRRGNIWIGSMSGVYFIKPRYFNF